MSTLTIRATGNGVQKTFPLPNYQSDNTAGTATVAGTTTAFTWGEGSASFAAAPADGAAIVFTLTQIDQKRGVLPTPPFTRV